MRARVRECFAGLGRALRSPATRIATAAGLFAVLFRFAPVHEVVSTIVSSSPGYLVAAWVLTASTPLLAARQLRFIAARQGLTCSVSTLLRINLATHFYGLFLPGYLAGGAIRWYRISREDGKPTEALACIGLNRLVDTMIPVGCGLLCWSLDRGTGSPLATNIGWVLLGIVVIAAVGLGWKRPWAWAASIFSTDCGGRLTDGTRWPAFERARAGVERLVRAVLRHHDGSFFERAAVLAISALRFSIDLTVLWLFARAIGADVSIFTLGWVRSVVGLLTMLPVSVSGIGIREGGMAVLLVPYGVEAPAAVALAVLVFSQVLLKAIAGAALESTALLTRDVDSRPPAVLEADR